MGALYGVADNVGWIKESTATKRSVHALRTNITNNHQDLKLEIGGITQSISFIKDNAVTKEEFQSLRRELFEDLAFVKKLLTSEISQKVDTVLSLYKEQEDTIARLMARQDCFNDSFEDGLF